MTIRSVSMLLAMGLVLAGWTCPAASAAGSDPIAAPAKEKTAAEFATAAEASKASLVRVEFTLRYDSGEPPQAGGWGAAGDSGRSSTVNVVDPVREERPLEIGGYLVSDTRVVLPDPMIHPRFVKEIAVRFGDDLVKAKPAAYARDQNALVLDLERPLKGGAKPLKFDATLPGPYLTVSYLVSDGAWIVGVDSMPTALIVEQPGRRLAQAVMGALVVDKNGSPVGLTMAYEVPADGPWKGSPLEWPLVSAAEMAKRLADLERRCDASILHVSICFRSPRTDAGRGSEPGSEEERCATEIHTTGVLVGPSHVLVLENLRPKTTARIESITVHTAKGDLAPAKFTCSLADYGAVLATLEKPLDGAVAVSSTPILDYRSRLLLAADVTMHGEDRTVRFNHRRIEGFDVGWRRQVYPYVAGREDGLFLFDADGSLVAVPVARREKVVMADRDSAGPRLTPLAYLKDVIENPLAHSDANNVPLSEEEEARLAWLGAELQPLDPSLAREHKVADQTHDGRTGAVVSYVYPGSPADKAGVKTGDVLLRLLVEGQGRPVEVVLGMEEDVGDLVWRALDEAPEEVYDRIPTPWPSTENRFTRALTDLGFGTKFTAVFVRDGKTLRTDFAVDQSPPHYETAPRYKSAALGITVRDVTYELRRYFRKAEGEPGVIVSRLEPGSKASVAGIKPYEIITHVGDAEVKNVKDFERLLGAAGEELRLNVKRMTQGRVVRIKMGAAAEKAKAPMAKE